MLKETEVMVPIIKDKLSESIDDLQEFLDENGDQVKELSEEIHTKATEQVNLSKAFLESIQEEASHA